MKFRYLGFSWPAYYPGGGTCDLVIKSNDLQEVRAAIAKTIESSYHGGSEIFDCLIGEVIEEDGKPAQTSK